MNEYRIWGPPGTGKTTRISEMASRAISAYGEELVSICSLTNAAVSEIASRGIPSDCISTLHAKCKRSLQASPPAESKFAQFKADHPRWAGHDRFPQQDFYSEIEGMLASTGATTYDQAQILRQQMIPPEKWNADIRGWHEIWSRWCLRNDLMDYTGWLETALEAGSLPPQEVVFVDEAQDHTPLQLAVLRAWPTKRLVLVGDDDQSLYEWSGVIPKEFFSEDVPYISETTLSHSHRVPRVIHDKAMQIISRVKVRKDKDFSPINRSGRIGRSLIGLRQAKHTMLEGIGDGSMHMILTTCAYMLDPIIQFLQSEGVLYWNPYRFSEARWNPLTSDTAIAIRKYIREPFTGRNIKGWTGIIRDEAFRDYAGLIKACTEHPNKDQSDLLRAHLVDGAGNLLSRSPRELVKWRRVTARGPWDYLIRVMQGSQALDPKVIVGTIHSVKGGEADTVHIFPDLSKMGEGDGFDHGMDRLHRLFYVALTRSKDRVIIHESSSSRSYPI